MLLIEQRDRKIFESHYQSSKGIHRSWWPYSVRHTLSSNAQIVGSDPAQGMVICLRLCCVCGVDTLFLRSVYKQGSQTKKSATPWTPLVAHAMKKIEGILFLRGPFPSKKKVVLAEKLQFLMSQRDIQRPLMLRYS